MLVCFYPFLAQFIKEYDTCSQSRSSIVIKIGVLEKCTTKFWKCNVKICTIKLLQVVRYMYYKCTISCDSSLLVLLGGIKLFCLFNYSTCRLDNYTFLQLNLFCIDLISVIEKFSWYEKRSGNSFFLVFLIEKGILFRFSCAFVLTALISHWQSP